MEIKNKLIKKVPEEFWTRFKKKCKEKRMKIIEGFMDAVSEWMAK